jgi:dihydroorotate dehydrogenase/Pyruvate/2-oxoacid:ferredoxin oxidoreductase delta subunit
MVDLSVKFAGLEFKNPVSIAAHAPCVPRRDLVTPEVDLKLWRKYYEGGVGSLTTGTIFFDEMADARGSIRFCPISTKGFAEREGAIGAATMPDCLWPRTPGLRAVERAKKEFKDVRIIASIMGPEADPKGWGTLALEAQQAGADAIEMNLGSVMMIKSAEEALKGITLKRALPPGAIIGLVPDVVAEIVKGIKKMVSVPVIVKVTPELGFYGLLGALPYYREAKVDGLLCVHSIMTIPPPDIYKRGATTFPHFKTTTWWSTIGPWNRMVSYRDVACVGKYAPDIDLEACAGFVIPEHVIEVMMLGAKVVQLSAGIFMEGISFPGRVVQFMKKYMKEQGYNNPMDFIGLGLRYIVEMGQVQAEYREQVGKVIAHVDYDKCVGPDSCRICLDTWCIATYEKEEKAMVNPELCCGCNLCVIRCPHQARSLGM